jgi:AraC-like DNA-binding protein/quercetin dioxygenase-like cupin family protein
MSQKRHMAIFDRLGRQGFEVLTLTQDYPAGHVIPLHFHDRDQLVFASRGVMTVRTEMGAWVVPTHRAVWIPARVTHTITMSGMLAMRTLYFKPRLAKGLPRDCRVVNVSALLRELILQACNFPGLKRAIDQERHLIDLIVDQLCEIQVVPLQLPHPSDPRALHLAEAMLADPGDRRTLLELCRTAGASKRTVERVFQTDVGMTLGGWRQQLRLMHAMRLLAEGAKVTHAALEAGYSTPSAFISMFRRALGTTPTLYFRAAGKIK